MLFDPVSLDPTAAGGVGDACHYRLLVNDRRVSFPRCVCSATAAVRHHCRQRLAQIGECLPLFSPDRHGASTSAAASGQNRAGRRYFVDYA